MGSLKKLLRDAIEGRQPKVGAGFGDAFSFANATIDDAVGGLRPRQIALIAGNSTQAMLAWALQIVHEASAVKGKPTLLLTSQYERSDVATALIASRANVSIASLHIGELSDTENYDVTEAVRVIASANLDIQRGTSIPELRGHLEAAGKVKLAVLCIGQSPNLPVEEAVELCREITDCRPIAIAVFVSKSDCDELTSYHDVDIYVRMSISESTKAQPNAYPVVINVLKSPISKNGSAKGRYYPSSARLTFNRYW